MMKLFALLIALGYNALAADMPAPMPWPIVGYVGNSNNGHYPPINFPGLPPQPWPQPPPPYGGSGAPPQPISLAPPPPPPQEGHPQGHESGSTPPSFQSQHPQQQQQQQQPPTEQHSQSSMPITPTPSKTPGPTQSESVHPVVLAPEGVKATESTPQSYAPTGGQQQPPPYHWQQLPPGQPSAPSTTSGSGAAWKAPKIPHGMVFAEVRHCQEAWSKVETQLEDTISEHGDTVYGSALQSFQKLLENLGGPTLVDASIHALGPKGNRQVGQQLQKLRKRIQQLASRSNLASKYPEYQQLFQHFVQQIEQHRPSWDRAEFHHCQWPAMVVHFCLQLIGVEDETEKQLLNFAEPFSQIASALAAAAKKDVKKNKDKDIDAVIFENDDVKVLDKLAGDLKKCASKKGKSASSSSSGGSNITLYIVLVFVLLLVLVAIVVIVFILRKRRIESQQ